MNTDADDISMLAEIQTDTDDLSAIEFEKEIPIMPLRNMVMFPSVVMPVTIGRPSTLKLVNAAYKKKSSNSRCMPVQGDLDDPGFADLYHVGVIAKSSPYFWKCRAVIRPLSCSQNRPPKKSIWDKYNQKPFLI